MSTFKPGPDAEFAYDMNKKLQKAISGIFAQALPVNPAVQMQKAMNKAFDQSLPESFAIQAQRAMGKMFAQQINQSAASSAALALNRMAAIQRPELVNASESLAKIAASSLLPLVRVQARLVHDVVLRTQWQITMIDIYPAFRAKETLESISRLTSAFKGAYYSARPGYRPYVTRTPPPPPDPEPSEIEPTHTMTEAERVEHLRATLEDTYSIIKEKYWGVYGWVDEHSNVILVIIGSDSAKM
jgi:hypothetical protein